MTKQVVTIGPNGEVSGLQVKPGKGVDLRQFGQASIKRASDIEWDEGAQAWTVRLLSTSNNGMRVTHRMWNERIGYPVTEEVQTALSDAGVADQPMYFGDYDDAVKAEIAYLDAIRLQDGADALN